MLDEMILGLAPGVHELDMDAYHADRLCVVPTLSSGVARTLLSRSPKHAWTQHPRLNPDHEPEEKKAFDIGRAAHRAVLGKGGMFVAYPDDLLATNGAASTAAAREWAEEMRSRGMVPVKAEEADAVNDMAGAVMERLAMLGIAFPPARSELTALAEVDGVMVRAMIDHAPEDPAAPLWDLKTTTNAHPDAVIRAVCDYGYDVQARFYQDAWRAATGQERPFIFVFVEKEPPYGVSFVELFGGDSDADWSADSASKCREARRIWAECLTAGEWPSYPAMVARLGAPSWHRSKWADRETGMPVTRAAIEAAMRFQAP